MNFYYCPECGHEMFYHIDYDCLICIKCGHNIPAYEL